jgi:hypothetical protein
MAMHHELREIEEVMARLDSRVEYLEAEIKIAMGSASGIRGIATWETRTSNLHGGVQD